MEKEYGLPKEFAEKWLAALRSGEYRQGKEVLMANGCYCALGVACKVAGIDDEKIYGWSLTNPMNIPQVELLPQELIYTSPSGDGSLDDEISYMNDRGKSLPEIADWIEANVELY